MIYKTNKIILQPFTRDHETNKYYDWFSIPEVNKYNSHGAFPRNQGAFDDFMDEVESNKILVWAIIIIEKKTVAERPYHFLTLNPAKIEQNKHIGNISLHSIDWINRSAELSVIIGETDYWKKGITTEAGKIVLWHGFEKLNMNRIWLGTSGNNIGMNRVAKKIGMIQEGNLRQGIFLNGKFKDVINYSILREEWNEPIISDK